MQAQYPVVISQSGYAASSAAVDFFRDTPWGNVPSHRLAQIEMIPLFPRYGLLGGSAKPSKLAALAAARKRKEEERQTAAQGSPSDRSIALLNRLGTHKENLGSSTSISLPSNRPPTEKFKTTTRLPTRLKRSSSPVDGSQPEIPFPKPEQRNLEPEPREDLRAAPSMFAQTMFGQRTTTGGASLQTVSTSSPNSRQEGSMFTLPYVNDPDFIKRYPFSGPSPDDVVLHAQMKGSAHV